MANLKLLVDLTAIDDLTWGVAVYSVRLLRGFERNGVEGISLLVTESIYDQVKKAFPRCKLVLLDTNVERFYKICHLSGLRVGWKWKRAIEKTDCDVFFSPTSSVFHFWKLKKVRVQTIHDLQGLRVYSGKKRFLHNLLTPLVLCNSDTIIAISEYVKQDILKTYKWIYDSKIVTIHNSVIVKLDNTNNVTDTRETPYILYVNALKEYKNIITLIKAFTLLKSLIPHNLVIIGQPTDYWNSVILPLIAKCAIEERIVYISSVSEEELVSYYKNASLFVTTSLYEGFGYTPIEAAICCTPVISTRESALYETTLGLLNYYEPAQDAVALKDKILEVFNYKPTEVQLQLISDEMQRKYDYITQSKKIFDLIKLTCKK